MALAALYSVFILALIWRQYLGKPKKAQTNFTIVQILQI